MGLPADGLDSLPTGTIVDVAVANDDLNSLVDAVVAAGLAETLSGDNDGNGFTVFAPLDSAFASLPEGTIATEDILLYHVVPSIAFSSSFVDGDTVIETLNGASLTVSRNEFGVFVNGFAVVGPDVATTNGVVHVVDGVLLPPAPSTSDDSLSGGAIPALWWGVCVVLALLPPLL